MGALQGYRNGSVATISATWTGATNVFASDDSDAAISANNTDSLRPQTYNFAIPSGSIIRGVEVSIEGEGDNATPANRDLDVSITLDGSTAAGTSKTFTLPQTTDGVVVGGGAADLWGITLGLDVAQVNASTFGVHIVKNTATGAVTIDHVAIRVYYDAGIRGEFHIDYNRERITLKHLYIDYDTGTGGTTETGGTTGAAGSGGSDTGGTAGAPSGGTDAGGAPSGGTDAGGAPSGGTDAGGAPSGGSAGAPEGGACPPHERD